MWALRNRIKKAAKSYFQEEVTFSSIRFDIKECYLKEGYGGKPIECWPVYDFYGAHLAGDLKSATELYKEWYTEQFKRYREIPKARGGMLHGSLDQLILDRHRQRGMSTADGYDARVVSEAISQRVGERFWLIDSIRQKGYHHEK